MCGAAGEDVYQWSKELTGRHLVKSAYKLLQVYCVRWNSGDNSGFWRSAWNLKVPPEIVNLIWRAAAAPQWFNLLGNI